MTDLSAVPKAQPASTVLLLRDRPQGGFEVFMVQRSMKSSFMPGAYVFPGGAVDPEDWDSPRARAGSLSSEEAASRFGGTMDGDTARAFLVAAVREVEEESHVRLPDVGDLVPFSHWVTPEIESRRFDTWFLVTRLPADATAHHDDYETVASRWVEPRETLARYGDGELVMAPPTYYTIWDLARFDSAQAVLEDAAARDIVAVQPRMEKLQDRWAILLPGDELFPSERPVLGPTRVVMGEGGRWWVVDRSETTG